jgi:predicted AlkP superfamily pyrophosphatase or phosphodiesterase
MNKYFALLTLCVAVCLQLFAQQPVHVIVLGFDGMSGCGVKATHTPNFDSIKAHGAYTLKAETVLPTVSSPNWASMINGATPNQHTVHSNDWKRENIKNKSFNGQPKGEIFPTIFKVIRAQHPTAKIECVHDWDDFARLANTESMDTCINANGEYETCRLACELIKKDKPEFLFLHFDHVDHVGHSIGHMTPAYFKAIELADSLTGVIVSSLKEAGIYDNTYIIVTADHGGIRKGHGGLTRQEIEIPWLIQGPHIRQGIKLKQKVKQYDTPATVARILGVQPPACWKGKPVKEAFIND